MANGVVKGPVHINFPFRKPLEPETASNGENPAPVLPIASPLPYTVMARGALQPREEQIDAVARLIAAHPNGLILCGPDHPSPSFAAAVTTLARRCGYAILADALSNLRHGPHVHQGPVTGGYHVWLAHLKENYPRPDFVLRFGAVPTSSALAAYLSEVSPTHHWHIKEDGEWADDLHCTHTYLQCDPTLFCEQVAERLSDYHDSVSSTWADLILRLESETWAALKESLGKAPFFDGAAVYQLLGRLPEDAVLFAGNSLPVRHIDLHDRPSDRRLTIYGNRGASGIDGNVSTALGLAAVLDKRVVALLGDITFYHDMNGLLAVRQHQLDRMVFVVINNNGGGIFRRLPIAGHEPPFTDLFLTPHGLSFDHAAAMYGLHYCHVESESAFVAVLDKVFASDIGSYLIEIKSDSMADLQHQRRVTAEVAASYRQRMSTNS
jgi:2-succinyl-5-enolpyruvyl-6-hydroxy-3-cyclohexene-1-carboxylate synthase